MLRGGSLNSTCLHETSAGAFVRKTIDTSTDREYGYVRWYSQLKKLQRYNKLFPGLTPEVLDVGVNETGAYFDIEYIADSLDITKLFVTDQLSTDQLPIMHNALWNAFDTIHSSTYNSNANALQLYFVEEVEQKLKDARQFAEFEQFFQLGEYEYNGVSTSGIQSTYDRFKQLFTQQIESECYVHGNPTLENIMYSLATNKITFIDLYEEGIVDSQFMDYSQVLQCSNSHYSILNNSPRTIVNNCVTYNAVIPTNLIKFNTLFVDEIIRRYGEENYQLVKLFEATQFFRMLPFKCHAGDFTAAKFFYTHACHLINTVL
jgi:hypothetical protein